VVDSLEFRHEPSLNLNRHKNKNKTRNFLLSPACHCKAILRILALQVPAVGSPNFRPARPPRLVSGTCTSMGDFPFRECGLGVSNRYNLD
jgi:hypothetical protein